MRLTIISNICKLDLNLDNNTITKNSIKLLKAMAPQSKDVFDYCNYLGSIVDCAVLFQETLTEDGLCFTFNTFDSRHIFHEELYEELLY